MIWSELSSTVTMQHDIHRVISAVCFRNMKQIHSFISQLCYHAFWPVYLLPSAYPSTDDDGGIRWWQMFFCHIKLAWTNFSYTRAFFMQISTRKQQKRKSKMRLYFCILAAEKYWRIVWSLKGRRMSCYIHPAQEETAKEVSIVLIF